MHEKSMKIHQEKLVLDSIKQLQAGCQKLSTHVSIFCGLGFPISHERIMKFLMRFR